MSDALRWGAAASLAGGAVLAAVLSHIGKGSARRRLRAVQSTPCPLFEACVDSVTSGVEAERGGALRLELCSSLVEGGVSPSPGLLRALKRRVRIPIRVLVRPRGGDFLYSAEEIDCMLENIRMYKRLGADGIVTGALTAYGDLDTKMCSRLVAAARPLPVTLHRAIDVSRNPIAALRAAAAVGFDRVLTSGARASAGDPKAIQLLARMREVAASVGLRVVAGGGVTMDNIARIVNGTGITELHGTAGRVVVQSTMNYRPKPPLYMGGEKRNSENSEFESRIIKSSRVRAMVSALCAALE